MKTALKTSLVVVMMVLIGVMAGCAGGDRFIVHRNNGTVLDTKTHLMWAAKDNGSEVSWKDAKSYCENFYAGGYRDWRMPTPGELATLYDAAKTRPAPCTGDFKIHVAAEAVDITCFAVWTSETHGSEATQFSFVYGNPSPYLQTHTYGMRALPVRLVK